MLDATDIAEAQVMLREIRDLLREQRDALRRAVELLEMAHPHHNRNGASTSQSDHITDRSGTVNGARGMDG